MNTETQVASQVQAPKRTIDDISSMLLPLEGYNLLVPGVVVAEIVTFVPPEEDHDEEVPPWMLGTIYWRNQRVPLISYEVLTHSGQPFMSSHCRIAVMNKTGLSHQLDFFAVLLQGTPRLLRLTSEHVTVNNEKIIEEGQKMHVHVIGEEAIVPDVQYIEGAVVRYMELA